MKFILISFLGNTEYDVKKTYKFDKLKGLSDNNNGDQKKVNAYCSFEAIKGYFKIEKTILFLTKEANEKFEKYCFNDNIELKIIEENENFNELLKNFLEIYRNIQKQEEYKNLPIFIDLTHSYRHFTILKFLATLMHNFLSNDKAIYILYAKEKNNNEYEFIKLNEYVEYYELFQVIDYFIKDLYVPSFFYENLKTYEVETRNEVSIEEIFENLHKLGKNIRENNLESNEKEEIWTLAEDILKKVENLEEKISFLKEIFKNNQGEKFKKLLQTIQSLKDKEEYEKLITLSDITHERKLLLNSAVYLMEGMSEFIYWKFKNEKVLDNKTPEEYKNAHGKYGKYRTLNRLKKDVIKELLYNEDNKNSKQKSIENIIKEKFKKNLKDWKNFANSLDKVDKMRNNMAHVFRDIEYRSYENELSEILNNVKELINKLK